MMIYRSIFFSLVVGHVFMISLSLKAINCPSWLTLVRSSKFLKGTAEYEGNIESLRSAECKRINMLLIKSALLVGGTMGINIGAFKASPVSAQDSRDGLVSTERTLRTSSRSVVKRPSDEREYQAFTLPNGLRVLLVSDASSNRAAAALDVHVGSFSDPPELPGLAHFCEHMTFLGSRKYPGEDDFSSFLATHGGESNAYTDSEDTVYYFDVNSEALEESLDRFAQLFEAPLFSPSATSREINAIESEHSNNINDDRFRCDQIQCDSSNPAHPLNRFATGNKFTLETQPVTLGIDTRHRLLDFQRQYYSAGQMTLAVVGRQSLPQLKRWVQRSFSALTNSGQTDPAQQWWGLVPPYLPQQCASVLEVVPVGETRSLSLAWPIWVQSLQERRQLQRGKPAVVLAHLLGHEGAGSIHSLLVRQQGWANSVQAYVSSDVSDLQMFEVAVDLTEEGFRRRNEVTAVVFAYLDLLRSRGESGVPQYVLDELQSLSRIAFDYAEADNPLDYVCDIVASMQQYDDVSEYLTGPQLFAHPDRTQVAQYLQQLSPRAARLTVVAPELRRRARSRGRFYGTQFNNASLPQLTQQWERVRAVDFPQLQLPAPNDLIPSDFRLLGAAAAAASEKFGTDFPRDKKDSALMAPPALLSEAVLDSSKWEVWHKLDRSFKQPKVHAIISLALDAEKFSPLFVVNSKIFAICFEDSINEFLYDARLAGLSFQIEFTSRGLQLIFSGFSDKLTQFTERVCAALRGFRPEAAAYERTRRLLEREYSAANWDSQQPYQHASYFAALASESLAYPIETMRAAVRQARLEQLQQQFLASMLRESYGTALVVGNVDEQGARQLVQIVKDAFPFQPLPVHRRSRRRVALLPLAPIATAAGADGADGAAGEGVGGAGVGVGGAGVGVGGGDVGATAGGYRLRHVGPNPRDDNSAVVFYFQLPSRRPEEYMQLEVLAEVLQQPFYSSLRTQQQLGYIVFSGTNDREGVRSLTLAVQSAVVDGDELTRRIASFLLNDIPVLLADLTEERLFSLTHAIAERVLEPDQRLTTQAGRFWTELLVFDSTSAGADSSPVLTPSSRGSARSFSVLDSSPQDALQQQQQHVPLFDRAEREVAALHSVSLKSLRTFAQQFLVSPTGQQRRLLVSQISAATVASSAGPIAPSTTHTTTNSTTTASTSTSTNDQYVSAHSTAEAGDDGPAFQFSEVENELQFFAGRPYL